VGLGPSGAGLVPGQTAGIIAIRRPLTGIYCLIPASGIIPTAEAPVASGEARPGGSEVLPLAVVSAGLPNDCGSGEFEVKTYNLAPGPKGEPPRLSNQVAFTIVVP
jgi:hypothetical protein